METKRRKRYVRYWKMYKERYSENKNSGSLGNPLYLPTQNCGVGISPYQGRIN
jgi:hypothetical protein